MGRSTAAAGSRKGPSTASTDSTASTASTRARALVAVGLAAALAAGCSSSSTGTSSSGNAARGGGAPGSAPAGNGWDCGSCWDADQLTTGGATVPASPTGTAPTSTGVRNAPLPSTESSSRSGVRPGALVLPPEPASSDDNADFARYLAYRDAVTQLGVVGADLPVEGRRVIRVVDASGRPVLGADLAITDDAGAIMGLVKTYADGRAVFLPPPGAPASATYQVAASKSGVSASAALPPGEPELVVTLDAPAAPLDLDVVFVIDATSSMDDEVTQLQGSVRALAARLGDLAPMGSVRLGLTVYRDQGEDFVTRTFDLTGDLDAFEAALGQVRAGGGGDTPEAVDVGLHDALTKPQWRFGETIKLLVLVGDAPPHADQLGAASYVDTIRSAAQQGVKIMAIGADGLDDRGEYAFRQLAQATMGRFVLLTSGTTGTKPIAGRSHGVTEDELSRLPLDQLVQQLAADEVGLHG